MNEREYHDAIDRLRTLAVAAVTPEDFAAAAREAEHLLDAVAVSALACSDEAAAAERVEALSHIHHMLVRAVGLAVLRRCLEGQA
ncbi:MAG: hypothetical protein GX537_06680 [Actinobacteria bacterium]|nr:hypothetical protein [Actinomycetota bacterium]